MLVAAHTGNHDKAFHVFFHERAHEPSEALGVFFRAAEQDGVSVQVGLVFQFLGNDAVEDIGQVGQDDADYVRASLAEHAGGTAGLIIEPPGHFQDSLLGGLADAVFLLAVGLQAVVHDKGDQGDGNAGFAGDILDGDVFLHNTTKIGILPDLLNTFSGFLRYQKFHF